MSDVIDILDKKPHIAGKAYCIVCKHEWAAVAATGTFWLECPECHTERGVFMHYLIPLENTNFVCNHCKNHLFILQKDRGAFCIGCGFSHNWEVLAQ